MEQLKNFSLTVLIILFLSGCTVSRMNNINEQGKSVDAQTLQRQTLITTGPNEEVTIENGTLIYKGEPFSGEVITLFENGDTASVSSYSMGKEDGHFSRWYESRQKMEERYYEDGKKEGIHKAWYEDGKQRFIYKFKNGEYEGELKEWYPNGQMYKDFNYVNGYESGMQTAWETSGKLLANYEVKNGRKYGLIGTHNCKSLWDDEPKGDNNENSM